MNGAMRSAYCALRLLQLRPRRRVRAERNAGPCPVRRRFAHASSVTHGGKTTETGGRFLQLVAHIIEAGIGTSKAVDAPEPAQPITGLRERHANVPAAASLRAPRQRRHRRK